MSIESIHLFKKDDFTSLGIALADAYLLIEKFSKTKDSRAAVLKSFMLNSSRQRQQVNESYSRQKHVKPTVNIAFTWSDYCYKDHRYKQKRKASGGGKNLFASFAPTSFFFQEEKWKWKVFKFT